MAGGTISKRDITLNIVEMALQRSVFGKQIMTASFPVSKLSIPAVF